MSEPHYTFPPFSFRSVEGILTGPLAERELRPQVARLLELFLSQPQALIERETILLHVWSDRHVSTGAIPQLVLELRRELKAVGGDDGFVKTIPKKGYQWVYQPQKSPQDPVSLRWRRRGLWVALFAAALITAALWFWPKDPDPHRALPDQPPFRILVLPFENLTGVEANDWFKLGLMDVVAQDLDRRDEFDVIPVVEVLSIIEGISPSNDQTALIDLLFDATGFDMAVQTQISSENGQNLIAFSLYIQRNLSSQWTALVQSPQQVSGALATGLASRLAISLSYHPGRELFDADAFIGDAYAKALHYLHLEDYPKALPLFQYVQNEKQDFLWGSYYVARCLYHLSEYEQSEQTLRDLIDEAQQRGDEDVELAGLVFLSEIVMGLRRFDEALNLCDSLIPRFQESSNLIELANLWSVMGAAAQGTADVDRAERCYTEALGLFRKAKSLTGVSKALTDLGVLQLRKRRYGEAREVFEHAIQTARALGNVRLQGRLELRLGYALEYLGEPNEARQAFERGLELRSKAKDQRGVALAHLYLGQLLSGSDQVTAEEHLRQALELYLELKDLYNAVNVLYNLSHLANVTQDYDRSVAFLDQAFNQSREAGDQEGVFYTYINLFEVELRRGSLEGARHALERAEAVNPDRLPALNFLEDCLGAVLAYKHHDFKGAIALMSKTKQDHPNMWSDVHESYLAIYREALDKGNYVALPIEMDPTKWLLD